MTRIRNVSPLGDLHVTGFGAVAAGAVIDTDDQTLIDSPDFEPVTDTNVKPAPDSPATTEKE